MIKRCLFCGNFFEGNSRVKYCPGGRCKKNFENSKRNAHKGGCGQQAGIVIVSRPDWLNPVAAAYWDLVAPTAMSRGHLNILSRDSFAELCDVYSKLMDINKIINHGKSDSLAPIVMPIMKTMSGEDAVVISSVLFQKEENSIKESVLSDLKRKYSRQYLDYCKAFYMTPMSNRGNFGLKDLENEKSGNKEDGLFD
jgi:phage terminase small subunit